MIQVTGPLVFGINNAGRKNIIVSLSTPISSDGIDGDIWFKYV
jgi:hypothetical protein